MVQEPSRDHSSDYIPGATVIVLLVALLLPIYSNSLQAPFHFDDKPNIVDNSLLHLDNLSPSSLWQTFFAMTGKKVFYRPLPYFTLALNWYFSQEDTFGYHLVNIAMHLLTALLLYLTVCHLLRTPRMRDSFSPADVQFIALLSSVLWAINPIQIQAVTYIVQRMAIMAAMFYILGIYCYLKARLSQNRHHQWIFGTGCLLAYLLAYLSKENAAILPLSVLLLEVAFFGDPSKIKRIKQKGPLLFNSCIVLALVFFLIAAILVVAKFSGSYGTRPYTMTDRLLTQPRVVLFYVSQIFYPLPSRLSITHDVVLAKSLFVPWSTLPAILTIAALGTFALWRIWKAPLVAFAILFFFLNHIIESSVIPLELIFEHRNYLPSMFLFVPIAAGIHYLLKIYNHKNRFLFGTIVGFVILLIIGWGNFTYLRNQAWKTETALWTDAMHKAPNDARPISNVAINLAWGEPTSPIQSDVALKLLNRARNLNTAHEFLNQDVLYNMASIYFDRGDFPKAIELYSQTLRANPSFLKARYHLTQALIIMDALPQASAHADLLLNNRKKLRKPEYYNIKGFILLWLNQPADALPYFQKALGLEPDNVSALLNAGVALSRLGHHDRAERFLKSAIQGAPEDIRSFFALIENTVRSNDLDGAAKQVRMLFKRFTLQQILDSIKMFSNNYRTAPLAAERIFPVIKEILLQTAAELRPAKHLSTKE